MESQKFGRYEIKGEIGRGGMATVYHAYDPRFEREVAIKVLPHEMLHDAQFRTRFEREAKTIAMLEHPAIVPVHDFGEEDGQPYFVMRYMTGGSLSDRMTKGAVSIQEAARILAHIAPALDEAHAKGIIHRDLKPSNILFDQFNEPYISDFGIAKLSESQTNVTGSAIIGTPAYMSPEQAQGESIDGRSDIYGLGVILFEMLTGQQPYHGDTPMSVVVKQIIEPVPHILAVKPDLPPDTEMVIEKAMAKNRRERYQDVKTLSNALSSVARGERLVQETPSSTAVALSKEEAVPELPSAPAAAPPIPSQPVVKTPAASQPAASSARPSQPAAAPQTSSQPPAGTVVARRPQVPQVLEPVPGPARSRKKIAMWVVPGVLILSLCVLAVIAIVYISKKIPFLGASVPTQTQAAVQFSPAQTLTEPVEATAEATSVATEAINQPAPTNTIAPTEPPAPTQTLARQAAFKVNANVRSGPGTMYPVLSVSNAGTQVEILGRNHAGDWLAFALPGNKQGWVSATSLDVNPDFINSLAELQAPPVPTAPPQPTPTPVTGGQPKPTIAPP